MSTFPNPMVDSLLVLAGELAVRAGTRSIRQTAARRAVSSAYYALFHALCYVCADGLVRWSRPHLVQHVYRSLDHGTAKRRLVDRAAMDIHPSVNELGSAFRELQEQRHSADYDPPAVVFTRTKALALIQRARDAVELVQQLDAEARTRLALHLLLSKRPA